MIIGQDSNLINLFIAKGRIEALIAHKLLWLAYERASLSEVASVVA